MSRGQWSRWPPIRLPLNCFRNCQRLNRWIVLNTVIEPPQKLASGLRIKLPGVLAIKNDWHHRGLAFGQHRLGGLLHTMDKVIGRLFGGHTGINKADQVRERMVTEYHAHFCFALLPMENPIKLGRAVGL